MAHGFSAVKEMYLDLLAKAFAATGLAAVVFDNRSFGASEGEPRQEIDPWQQINDYRDAISYALRVRRPTEHASASGAQATSGGHVLVLGATDRRIECVALQVPLMSGYRAARRPIRADMLAPVLAMCPPRTA
jgi:alpha-beta hydrolase superfamily lysophospholipase